MTVLFLLNPVFVVDTSKINCASCVNPTSYTEFSLNQIRHKSKPNVGNAWQDIKNIKLHKKRNTKKVGDFMI